MLSVHRLFISLCPLKQIKAEETMKGTGKMRVLYSSAIDITKEMLEESDSTVSISTVLEKQSQATGVGVHIYRQKKNRDIIRAIERLIATNVKIATCGVAKKWAEKKKNTKEPSKVIPVYPEVTTKSNRQYKRHCFKELTMASKKAIDLTDETKVEVEKVMNSLIVGVLRKAHREQERRKKLAGKTKDFKEKVLKEANEYAEKKYEELLGKFRRELMFYVKDFEPKIEESIARLGEVEKRLSSLETQVSSLAESLKRSTRESQAELSSSSRKPESSKKPIPVVNLYDPAYPDMEIKASKNPSSASKGVQSDAKDATKPSTEGAKMAPIEYKVEEGHYTFVELRIPMSRNDMDKKEVFDHIKYSL